MTHLGGMLLFGMLNMAAAAWMISWPPFGDFAPDNLLVGVLWKALAATNGILFTAPAGASVWLLHWRPGDL